MKVQWYESLTRMTNGSAPTPTVPVSGKGAVITTKETT
jgi:hypothetical protein